MEFQFQSDGERTALTKDDKHLYPLLGFHSYGRVSEKAGANWPLNLCSDLKDAQPVPNAQPDKLPMTSNDLQESIDVFKSIDTAKTSLSWSVYWLGDKPNKWRDFVDDDQFRRAIIVGNIELSMKPVHGGDKPKRIFIRPADAHDCIAVAQNVVLNEGPNTSIAAVTGKGFVINPQNDLNYRTLSTRYPKIEFEWKIVLAPEDLLGPRVHNLRLDMCGGYHNYYKRQREYLNFLLRHGLKDPRQGMRDSQKEAGPRSNIGPSWTFEMQAPAGLGEQSASHAQPTRGPQQTMHQQGKRPSWEMGSQEFGPGLKRRSTGSQTWGSSSQSSFESPELSQPPSVAGPPQYIMGPPPPGNIERPMLQPRSRRGSRGSRGSIGSGTARVTSGMAGLTVQSPSLDSPEGAPWGTPQTMVGSTFGQPGWGYGQYSQGYMPQNPAYGQQTEVYGHLGQDPQGPPVRQFQVGIAHTQIPGGQWPPPQASPPGQRPIEQAPVQYSYPPGQQAGFTQWQPGPEVQGGGGYPPAYPPSQPGRGTHFPQQSQHMAAVPPMGGSHLSISQNMPLTESPATPSTGVNVFDFLVPETGSSSGRASTSLPYQEPSGSAPAGWTDQYGLFHPWQTDRSRGS